MIYVGSSQNTLITHNSVPWPRGIAATLNADAVVYLGTCFSGILAMFCQREESIFPIPCKGKMKVMAQQIVTDHGPEGPFETPELITWDVKAYQKTNSTYSFE